MLMLGNLFWWLFGGEKKRPPPGSRFDINSLARSMLWRCGISLGWLKSNYLLTRFRYPPKYTQIYLQEVLGSRRICLMILMCVCGMYIIYLWLSIYIYIQLHTHVYLYTYVHIIIHIIYYVYVLLLSNARAKKMACQVLSKRKLVTHDKKLERHWAASKHRLWVSLGFWWVLVAFNEICPLVNIQKTMENHHFSWENSL